MTTAAKIDGKRVAADLKTALAVRVKALHEAGIDPGLGTILVGDDPGSRSYVAGKHRDCAEVGIASIRIELPASASQAEIGIEHNLGLTCDPVGGLVQIPCIERNAIASNKAINAARIAARGDGSHRVSLDAAIKTMRETGADMKIKYKETSRGGLAVNVIEC